MSITYIVQKPVINGVDIVCIPTFFGTWMDSESCFFFFLFLYRISSSMPLATVDWWGLRGCSLLQTTAPSYEWKHWRWPCPLSKEPLMLMSTKKSIANSLKPPGNSSSISNISNITCMALTKIVLKIFVNTETCKVSLMQYRREQLNPLLLTQPGQSPPGKKPCSNWRSWIPTLRTTRETPSKKA